MVIGMHRIPVGWLECHQCRPERMDEMMVTVHRVHVGWMVCYQCREEWVEGNVWMGGQLLIVEGIVDVLVVYVLVVSGCGIVEVVGCLAGDRVVHT